MNSLKEGLLNSFRYQAETQGKTHRVYVVADELGLLEAENDSYYANESIYDDSPTITLSFYSTFSGTPAENMAAIAKTLLPKLGKLRKEFNEMENRINLVSEYKGVKIVLSSETPKTCVVEKVEEVVEVPEQVIPAHQEKKVRWVMKGDCDPLIATPEEVSTGA